MANSEHLRILRSGHNAWNRWRAENPGIIPDLSGADLSGARLASVDLHETNLAEADLSRADLRNSNLRRAVLAYANLSDADLTGAALWGINWTGANLWTARLPGIQFSRILWMIFGYLLASLAASLYVLVVIGVLAVVPMRFGYLYPDWAFRLIPVVPMAMAGSFWLFFRWLDSMLSARWRHYVNSSEFDFLQSMVTGVSFSLKMDAVLAFLLSLAAFGLEI